MSKIIGLHVNMHDTTIAYIEDGEIKCILEEEKISKIKSCYNINCQPNKSLDILKHQENIDLSSCDYIAYSNPLNPDFFRKNRTFFKKTKTFFYSHHKCHAIGAYLTSGFKEKTISVSLDGKGNQSRGKIYLCENGKYEQVHSIEISTNASLATLWLVITENLGWQSLKDEGKVVGLAAHGKFSQEIYSILNECFFYENFLFGPCDSESLLTFALKNLKIERSNDLEYKQDLAYTLQYFTEECIYKYLNDIHLKYPQYKKLCLSGGLFANVKLNKYINELSFFDEIYIHPAMSDAGLALGAALCCAHELNEYKDVKRLNNIFLGQKHDTEAWKIELYKHVNKLNIIPYSINKIAQLINDGYIIGLFIGKTEYGPRSLGNRSIIVRPTDKETHHKLNTRLRRNDIMPFAPSVLEEYFDDIFINPKSKYAAEFMTLCYDTKKEWLNKIPAVVHEIDGTCRPQLVKKSQNPHFYSIINEYYKISNIPIVLNTSLNAHGEPINNYPDQVMQHLLDNSIDFLVTEDFIISKK
jgi:carbamoyltransferase